MLDFGFELDEIFSWRINKIIKKCIVVIYKIYNQCMYFNEKCNVFIEI